jgi:hypothetical protein
VYNSRTVKGLGPDHCRAACPFLTALPTRNVPKAMHTIWNARAPQSAPRLVNPSAREKTPPTTATIQTRPSTNSRIPAIHNTIFITPPCNYGEMPFFLLGRLRPGRPSQSQGFHEQPQGQNSRHAVEKIPPEHPGVKARTLAADHARHNGHDSGQ